MHLSVPSVLRRIEATSLEHGVAYPWWMPVLCKSGQVLAAFAAFVQRDRLVSWQCALALAFLVVPVVIEVRSNRWLPAWPRVISHALAFGMLVITPITSGPTVDAAIIVLGLVAADFAARDGAGVGLIVAVLAAAAVPLLSALPDTNARVLSVLAVGLGVEAGFMVRWGARAVFTERQARAEAYERATLAERDRIAREIHDLVAHSLSVTMLQVTAARRILDDLTDSGGTSCAKCSKEGDIREAVGALGDAERIGRQAMADIRQTVSGMAEPGERRPLPTADDLPLLVGEFRAAGQSVDLAVSGDLSRLTGPVGLGLYRVAQESLANVVKHATDSTAEVELEVTARQARLTVRNPVDAVRLPADNLGSGLAGMRARIEQLGGRLTAGRGGQSWIVQAVVPMSPPTRHPGPAMSAAS
jgi:signal transduction histidine kinase